MEKEELYSIHMTKNPFLNAISATVYISLVATLMYYGPEHIGPADSVIIPIAMLSLLVFSVAVMGFIFFYQPMQIYFDGDKKGGVKFFLKTLLTFGAVTFVIFVFMWVCFRIGLSNSYKNATYKIDGVKVELVNGVSEKEVTPGSAAKITTKYFGNEAKGDLNGDGTEDTAFLLTQDGSGSGTFYYVVVALKMKGGYRGTNAILLGDRIAPQTTEINGVEIVVNYAERSVGEPMTARPSVGVSKYLIISEDRLIVTK